MLLEVFPKYMKLMSYPIFWGMSMLVAKVKQLNAYIQELMYIGDILYL